ncbi:MAG: hypothetical protein HKN17_05360 [Rhodothermales bacterium]|nr:hypothetical protein [Rhodothermales bacterium]
MDHPETVETAYGASLVSAVPDSTMSFFLTSANPGNGAALGGLEGADAWCATLADSAGAADRTWRAYLSTSTVNAKDRIGSGPWHNADGVEVAASIAELHGDNNLTKQTVLTERGEEVNGRGDDPNRHDILTGSTLDGMSFGDSEEDTTCSDWTSSSADGSARVGHHDRTGGGEYPESWNSAHGSRGCGLENLRSTGGDGLYYCFATNE